MQDCTVVVGAGVVVGGGVVGAGVTVGAGVVVIGGGGGDWTGVRDFRNT